MTRGSRKWVYYYYRYYYCDYYKNNLLCTVSENGPPTIQREQVSGDQVREPSRGLQDQQLGSKPAAQSDQVQKTISSTEPVPTSRPGQAAGQFAGQVIGQQQAEVQVVGQRQIGIQLEPAERANALPGEQGAVAVQQLTTQSSTRLSQEQREYAMKTQLQRQQNELVSENKTEAEERKLQDVDVKKQETGQQTPQEPPQQADQSAGVKTESSRRTETGEKTASEKGDQAVGQTKLNVGAEEEEEEDESPAKNEVFIHSNS